MNLKLKKGNERVIWVNNKGAVHAHKKVVSTFEHGVIAFETEDGKLHAYTTGGDKEIIVVVDEKEGGKAFIKDKIGRASCRERVFMMV